MPNYIQPNSGNPAPNPNVTVQPHQPGAVTGNPLSLTAPLPLFAQPGGTNKPSAPVAGQLDNTPLGRSKITRADGTSSST
jgi:hypothetical protein